MAREIRKSDGWEERDVGTLCDEGDVYSGSGYFAADYRGHVSDSGDVHDEDDDRIGHVTYGGRIFREESSSNHDEGYAGYVDADGRVYDENDEVVGEVDEDDYGAGAALVLLFDDDDDY